jgi:serine/threonine-protein kinase
MESSLVPLLHELPAIPGYQLLEPIGAGSMGAVYRAQQFHPPRTVAIKFLLRQSTDRSGVLGRRYQRESQLMASLHHPNVVAMYDCGMLAGSFYIVMEHVAGSTLRTRMKPGEPWPVAQAAPVLRAVGDALCYIHAQGILHLDLKPENILCGEQGTIKVTDFGLALLQINVRALAEMGGTMDYCAPEQHFGFQVDARSDLFSLATIAYELLSGRVPGRVYRPCLARQEPVAMPVDEVLRRALAREPDERHASLAEFHHELALALQAKGG